MSFFRSTILMTTALTLIVICTVAADAQEKTAELANNSDLGIEDEDFLVPSARTKRSIEIVHHSRPCNQITNERNKLRNKIQGLNRKLKQYGSCKNRNSHLQRQVQTCKLTCQNRHRHTAWHLTNAKNTIAREKQQIVRNQARILQLTNQVRTLQLKLYSFRMKSLTCKRKYENTARHLKNAKNTIAKKTQEIVWKQARIIKLTNQVQNLQIKLDRCKNNPEIGRLRGQLYASQKEAKLCKRLEEKCKSDVVSVKKLSTETQRNLSNCQGRNEEKQEEINRLNVRLALLETSYSKLANNYNVTLRELIAKQQELAEAQKETQVREKDLIATNDDLTNAIASQNQWRQQVQALTEDLKRANRTAEKQLHTIAKVTSKLDECKRQQFVTTTTASPTTVSTTTTTTIPTTTANADSCLFFAYDSYGIALLLDGHCYTFTTASDDWANWKEVNDSYDGGEYSDVKGSVVVDSKNRHCLQQLLTKNNINISIDRFGDDWGEKHVGLLKIKQETCEGVTAHLTPSTNDTKM